MSVTALIDAHGVTVNTQRPSRAQDNSGFSVPTFANNLTSIKAFIQPRSGSEGVRYGRENTDKFHVIYVKAGQDITADDRIVYGSRVFDVQTIFTPGEFPTSSHLAHMKIEAQERD